MLFGTILGLGDSISFGSRAEHDGHAAIGYLEWLAPTLTALMAQPDGGPATEWAALNRGIAGQTTRQILDRTPSAVRELAGLPGAQWAIILAGTNDAKGRPVPLDEWEVLYRQILHWPRRWGIPMALCTFPPVDPAAMPAFTEESAAWLRLASARVRTMAERFSRDGCVRLVELEDVPMASLVDGVHLTREGNREVAARVASALTGRTLEHARRCVPLSGLPMGEIPVAQQPALRRGKAAAKPIGAQA